MVALSVAFLVVLVVTPAICFFLVVPFLTVRSVVTSMATEDNIEGSILTAEEAIARLGGRQEATRLLSFYLRVPPSLAPRRELAAQLLGDCGEGARPTLLACASDADPSVRTSVMYALGRMDDAPSAVVAVLKQALRDRHWRVRCSAANALGDVGPPAAEAVPDLVDCLRSSIANERGVALGALLKIGLRDANHVKALAQVVNAGGFETRVLAAKALGEFKSGSPQAVKLLVSMAQDSEWSVRYAAVEGLGNLGPKNREARSAIRGALDDKNESVQRAAKQALHKCAESRTSSEGLMEEREQAGNEHARGGQPDRLKGE